MDTCNKRFYNNVYVFLKVLLIIEVLKIYYDENEKICRNINQINRKSNVKNKDDKESLRIGKEHNKMYMDGKIISRKKNAEKKCNQFDEKKLINGINESPIRSSINHKCKTKKSSANGLTKGKIHIEKSKGNSVIKDNINSKSNTERNIKGKIPIIISEKNVFIPIETSLDLEEKALEIKGIDNNVYLNESILIPIENENKNLKYNTGKLFLKGIIRNCIQYSTITAIDDTRIKGNIRYCVNYIPFKCTTLINYNRAPKLNRRHNREKLVVTNSGKIKANRNEYTPKYNEPIYCNLIKAKIFGTRECCNKNLLSDQFPMESTFSILKEKMVVQLVLQLIQRQEININYFDD